MGALDLKLSSAQLGDLAVLEATSSAATMSNLPRRPGESMDSWGKRLKAADKSLWASQSSSKSSATAGQPFEQLHPRGRGGKWTVKQGQHGVAVRAVQAQVGATVDGQYGKLTKQAVSKFQRSHGLLVDGVVGAQTIAAMMGNKRAAAVQAGAMTPQDRKWLLRQLANGRAGRGRMGR